MGAKLGVESIPEKLVEGVVGSEYLRALGQRTPATRDQRTTDTPIWPSVPEVSLYGASLIGKPRT